MVGRKITKSYSQADKLNSTITDNSNEDLHEVFVANGKVSESTPLLAQPRLEEKGLSSKKSHIWPLSGRWRRKALRNFYLDQAGLLGKYADDEKIAGDAKKACMNELSGDAESLKKDRILAQASFVCNVLLLIAKAVVAYLTNSLSVISSVIDSAVDITSGIVIWATTRAIEDHDPYIYPRGRSKLEPLAVIIVSVIMAVASLQMIIQSIEAITDHKVSPNVDVASIVILVVVIVVKFILWFVCFRQKSSGAMVLAIDHRNDCVSNVVALVSAFLASKFWIYLDPIGAIIVALYIILTWFFTGAEQVPLLSGKAAKPEYVNRLIKLAIDHDERIRQIETVHVYHYGSKFLVEMHIVLDREMPLYASHDISEGLQMKLEHLPYVERAFVHCDYMSDTKVCCACGSKH